MPYKFNPFTGRLDVTNDASGTAGGDLSGTYPNPTVAKLQGQPVSSVAPVNGQTLQFNGTNWVPGAMPNGGSGGGGIFYYFNFETSGASPTTNLPNTPNTPKQLGRTGVVSQSSYTSGNLSQANYDLIAGFVTEVNDPSITEIPAGLWDFNVWASSSANSANQTILKLYVYKYNGVNSPTLLTQSDDVYIYDPTVTAQYVASVVFPQTTILATDRIYIELRAKATSNNRTVSIYFGDATPSHVHTTIPSVSGSGVVKVVNGVFQSPASLITNDDVSDGAAISPSKISGLASVATSGAYDDLSGKPTIPAAQVNSDWNATSGLAQILNKPTLFSGAYDDLTGKPFIPSTTDGLTEGTSNLYFTSARALSAVTWATLTGKPTFSAVATSGSASDLSAGTLALARLDPLVAIKNINNNFTVGQAITAAANTSALTASYSVTGANTTAIIDLSGVWNTTGVANGILLNITDTASNASSLLLDLRVGGASRFSITKAGSITASGVISCTQIFGSVLRAESGGATRIISGGSLGWSSSSSNPAIASDLTLFRDAANTLALRNGTNAQTSRVYGTWTDVSNGRWLSISNTTAGLVTLTATGNGTGATGNLLKITQPILLPASSVTLATNGDLAFEATSNTSLTIRYRGSDGTTRSAALTLA